MPAGARGRGGGVLPRAASRRAARGARTRTRRSSTASPARRGPRRRSWTRRTSTRRTRATTTRCPTSAGWSRSTRRANTSDAATWRVAWGDRRHGEPRRGGGAAGGGGRGPPALVVHPRVPVLGRADAPRPGRRGPRARAFRGDHPPLQARVPRPARAGGAGQRAAATRRPPIPASPSTEPDRTRIRQLLLIERLAEALDETRALPPTPQAQATRAWILWRQGQLRPAITAMRRAYPASSARAATRCPTRCGASCTRSTSRRRCARRRRQTASTPRWWPRSSGRSRPSTRRR